MFLKIHQSPGGGTVVAVCDRELINSIIIDGDREVPITESFYGTKRVTDDEVRHALLAADNANIMGERAVAFAVGLGIVSESSCIMIGRVPHALVFRL